MCEGWIPGLRSPFVPRRPGISSQVPFPPNRPPLLIPLVAWLSPSFAPVPSVLTRLSGPGRGEGPFSSPWGPLGPSGVRVGEGDNP